MGHPAASDTDIQRIFAFKQICNLVENEIGINTKLGNRGLFLWENDNRRELREIVNFGRQAKFGKDVQAISSYVDPHCCLEIVYSILELWPLASLQSF